MKPKKILILLLDVVIVITALVGINLTYTTIENRTLRLIIITVLSVLTLWVIIKEIYAFIQYKRLHKSVSTPSVIALLGDTEQIVRVWDLNKQIGVLVGKSSNLVDADIDLTNTEFAALLENEHATLNYTTSGWWIEDLGSRNGTTLHRKGKEILLAAGSPHRLLTKDIILLADHTRLAVR